MCENQSVTKKNLQTSQKRDVESNKSDIHWVFGSLNQVISHTSMSRSRTTPTESANVPTASYRISKFFAFQSDERRCNLYISTSFIPQGSMGEIYRTFDIDMLICVCEYFLNVNSRVIQVPWTSESNWDTESNWDPKGKQEFSNDSETCLLYYVLPRLVYILWRFTIPGWVSPRISTDFNVCNVFIPQFIVPSAQFMPLLDCVPTPY